MNLPLGSCPENNIGETIKNIEILFWSIFWVLCYQISFHKMPFLKSFFN